LLLGMSAQPGRPRTGRPRRVCPRRVLKFRKHCRFTWPAGLGREGCYPLHSDLEAF
jgi:hypothetical protein